MAPPCLWSRHQCEAGVACTTPGLHAALGSTWVPHQMSQTRCSFVGPREPHPALRDRNLGQVFLECCRIKGPHVLTARNPPVRILAVGVQQGGMAGCNKAVAQRRDTARAWVFHRHHHTQDQYPPRHCTVSGTPERPFWCRGLPRAQRNISASVIVAVGWQVTPYRPT
jgi:hypothetical protein